MGTIIALGGGEIGRPREGGGRYPVETAGIDREILARSGRTRPRVLFIPTASGDSQGYADVFSRHYGKLGVRVDVLRLLGGGVSRRDIERQVLGSDVVYVGGGNTLRMMMAWRRVGLDGILCRAYKKGIVLSGVSAGAICWFSYGNSDSRKFSSGSDQLIRVRGLGFINALNCPHFDGEGGRRKDLPRMMRRTHGMVAIALDNCCALEVVDGAYRLIRSRSGAGGYRCLWKAELYHEERIPVRQGYEDISSLLSL